MDQGQGHGPEISLVPIPSELPNKPDLTDLPSHILRSGAVESLISQNDDLMARLSVSLRRCALLEESVQSLEKDRKIWQHQLEVLREKILLIQEKERLASGRDRKFEDQIFQLRSELQLAETRYVELHTTSKDRVKALLDRIEEHARRLGRLLKYRSKIQRLVLHLKRERLALKSQVGKLQIVIAEQDVRIDSLQSRLDEMATYIQNQGRKFGEEKNELVQIYEQKAMELREQLHSEKQRTQALQNQLAHYEQTLTENMLLKTQLSTEKKNREEMSERLSSQITELERALSDSRTQRKVQDLNLEQTSAELAAEKSRADTLANEKARLQEQVESLQVFWNDSQKQLEKRNVRIESLQKLNQQLSISLNQFRKDCEGLKSKIESFSHVTQDRVKALKGEFQQARLEPELGLRIETLLAEIQYGATRRPNTDETEQSSPTIS